MGARSVWFVDEIVNDDPARAVPLGRVLWAVALALLGLAFAASALLDLPIAFFVRDPAATLDGHPLTGALSNLGILVWCTAAVICFFASALLGAPGRTLARFFFWSGVLTAILLLDDFFLFHDDLAKRAFGVPQRLVEVGYVAGVGAYLLIFRRVILESKWPRLLLALSFFAASMFVDQVQHLWPSPWRIGFEDGAKFLGIVAWMAYFVDGAFRAVAADHGPRGRPEAT